MENDKNQSVHSASDPDNDDECVEEEMRMRSFADQLKWLLSGLRAGQNTSTKALLIVLEEFDLFATHRNQALLYNLFDCCQSGGTPLCVIGVTCRLVRICPSHMPG